VQLNAVAKPAKSLPAAYDRTKSLDKASACWLQAQQASRWLVSSLQSAKGASLSGSGHFAPDDRHGRARQAQTNVLTRIGTVLV